MQELGRHDGLRMNTEELKLSQTFLSTYLWSISYVQTYLAKIKGLLIKIKVIKGFSAKYKV